MEILVYRKSYIMFFFYEKKLLEKDLNYIIDEYYTNNIMYTLYDILVIKKVFKF